MAFPLKPKSPIINWKNPLSTGIVFDVAFAENGSNTPIETITKLQGTKGGTPTWVRELYGPAINYNVGGTGAVHKWLDVAQLSNFNYITVQTVFNFANGGGGNYGCLFDFCDSTSTHDWFSAQFDNYSTGWGLRINTYYTTRERVWSIANPSTSVWHNLIITYDHTGINNVPIVWLDGVRQSVTDRFSAAQTWTLAANDFFVGNSHGLTFNWGGRIALSRMWNRMINAAEAKELSVNPFCVYKNARTM